VGVEKAGVGVAKRGTADAEGDATTGIRDTGEGRRVETDDLESKRQKEKKI